MELREDGGGRVREANDSSGDGDVKLINVCCLGSVRMLMLIESNWTVAFMEGISVL